MVKSLINPSIEHKETKYVDKQDINYLSASYDIVFRDIDPNKAITVTFGKINDIHKSTGISYFSMYLVVDEVVKGKVGLIEIAFGSERNIMDDDNDIDTDKMPQPLLFNFVNTNFINSFDSEMLNTDDTDADSKDDIDADSKDDIDADSKDDIDADSKDDADADSKDDVDADSKDDADADADSKDDADKVEEPKSIMESIFDVILPKKKEDTIVESDKLEPKENKASSFFDNDSNKSLPAILEEESKDDAIKIRNDFKSSSTGDWVKMFMKNNNYTIRDNDGSGDCLFIVIRDAYAEIGKNTTIPKLRELLSNEVTDEIFQNYRNVYLDMENQLVETSKIVDTNKRALKQLKISNNNSNISREDRNTIVKQARKHSDAIKNLKKDNQYNEQFMKYNFGFMKDIDNIDKFKDYIKTSSYWADTWAISTLEHKLNLKLIIFSEESYNENSYDSVLNCGELNKNIESSGSFNPSYYVMTTYNGNHYKSIEYKDKKVLTYREIPYDVKMLVVNKCLERNSGVFYMIQDFRNLKSNMGLSPDEGKDGEIITIDSSSPDKQDMIGNELYDPSIIFQIYHKSADIHFPRSGAGENMPLNQLIEFKDLDKIKDWRRKIDDDWTQTPFDLDGLRWSSVSHYVEGSKFKKGFPDFYKKFSINADAEETDDDIIKLSTDVNLAKEVGKKPKHSLRKNKEVIDPDYYQDRSEKELEDAIRAKFTQNEDMKSILKFTKNAKINRFIKGSPGSERTTLMRIRKELIEQ
jgi:predicted NAD-dependent protein-ADP-ribosyltransferase YbiA (DUF1768 family)